MKPNKYWVILIGLLLTGVVVAYQFRTTYFTLTGSLPAHFKLELTVRYEPKKGTDECVTNKQLKRYEMYLHPEVAWQDKDGDYRLEIPTFLKVKGCYLPIRSINIEARGKYGEYERYGRTHIKDSGERFAAGIGFFDVAAHNEKLLVNQPTEYHSLCQWSFRIMPEGLIKILICKAADEQWQLPADRFKQGKLYFYLARNNLAGQEITVDFRLDPNEEPYFDGSWLKTDKGWRRCLETEKTRRCQTPPTFTPFEMDGKTCTVYPNCTEE